jgi:hypothetical protein
MIIDESLRSELLVNFQPLNVVAAARAFPPPMALSAGLRGLLPRDKATQTELTQSTASYFATAAVDIWLRGVHSFLISASLTGASPIWAVVTGYYSSHYAVRGFAHLLGYFQLFRDKRIARLTLEGGHRICTFIKKNAGDGEHKLYWKLVKQSAAFATDDFFTLNDPASENSDIRHRNHANYADHVGGYPVFKPLDEQTTKDRIEFISKMVFDAPPLPRFSEFPDVEYVQVIAYHRLIRFRRLLDDVLGASHRFWSVHRNPAFAHEYIDFQLAERAPLAQPSRDS